MWSDNETSQDLLGFKVHADLLIDVINDEQILPVTIGVFGDWGSGKSSILQIIKSEYDKEENKDSLCVFFNGWTFEGYDDAKAALLNAILKELADNKKLSAEVVDSVKDKAKKLWKSIDWMRGAGMVMKNIALPAISAYFTSGVSLIPFATKKISEWSVGGTENFLKKIKSDEGIELIKSLQKEEPDDTEVTNAVADFRKDFEDILKETKFKRLLVIIDDLDRCTPDRIIDNLEAVKLFLNVPNTAFIIGADPRIVKHAVEYRYSKNVKSTDDNFNEIVKDYLEKVIQIPYSLPKLSDSEVETYISLLMCKKELTEEQFNEVHSFFVEFRNKDRYSVCGYEVLKSVILKFDNSSLSQKLISIPPLVPIITNTLSGNPRQIKRFLNTLTLRERLANVAKFSSFNSAILVKLMALEYSNTDFELFKQLYNWQVLQKGVPNEIKQLENIVRTKKENAKTEIEQNEAIKKWSSNKILNWLKTEPFLTDIDLSDYFWLSRDKISETISGASLIPPTIKNIYKELSIDTLTQAITKKIIEEKVKTLSAYELNTFLKFASQMLISSAKNKKGYDIFHALIDSNVPDSISVYAQSFSDITTNDIPPAVGEALKRYLHHEDIKEAISKKTKNSNSSFAKSLQP